MHEPSSSPTSFPQRPDKHLLFSTLALAASLVFGCLLAVGITKGVAQALMSAVSAPPSEEAVPSLSDILMFLGCACLGTTAGGWLSSFLQRRILFPDTQAPPYWTRQTIQLWCAGVVAILCIGIPLALMLTLALDRLIPSLPCRIICQPVPGGDTRIWTVTSLIAAGVGGSIMAYQLAPLARRIGRDSLWIGTAAVIWGGSWWYLLHNIDRIFL